MRGPGILGLAVLGVLVSAGFRRAASQESPDGLPTELSVELVDSALADLEGSLPPEYLVRVWAGARAEADFEAMKRYRPGYSFWSYVFTIPDGAVAFGSGRDGRLLATFPTRGDWVRSARWEDRTFSGILQGQRLERRLTRRRDQVAELLEPAVGPVLHNPTRGNFLLPNARRYGSFLVEWSEIYERFGVPAEIGLAQAIVESGLRGRIRSEARAMGLCQWLPRNWDRMKRQASYVIEAYNQTTQAPFCAAYLTVLATKYGTFIPALSEHHSGGVNVGRTIINGGRLGGVDARDQYLIGSQFAKDVRQISVRDFREIVRTYGPRSYAYTETVFGNALNVKELRETVPQEEVFAMRAARSIPLREVTRLTGLSVDEVRRFNPSLLRQVPCGANLYLPFFVEEFGVDVSFWHRPADPAFATVLNEFLRLETTPEEWVSPAFEPVLKGFRERFRETDSEEGSIMAAVLVLRAARERHQSSTSGRVPCQPEDPGALPEGRRATAAGGTQDFIVSLTLADARLKQVLLGEPTQYPAALPPRLGSD